MAKKKTSTLKKALTHLAVAALVSGGHVSGIIPTLDSGAPQLPEAVGTVTLSGTVQDHGDPAVGVTVQGRYPAGGLAPDGTVISSDWQEVETDVDGAWELTVIPSSLIDGDPAYYVEAGATSWVCTLPLRDATLASASCDRADNPPVVRGADGAPGPAGETGATGFQGPYDVDIWFAAIIPPTDRPFGGAINVDTGVVTPPPGWSTEPPAVVRASLPRDVESEDIGDVEIPITLPTNQNWVGTGIIVPVGVHILLIDASTASDDYHVVDWDTLFADTPSVAGAHSEAGEFETFNADTGLSHSIRLGHTAAGEILVANDTTSQFNLPRIHVRRLLTPAAAIGINLFFSRTHVDPARHTGTYTPVWTLPAEAGEQGPPGPHGPPGQRGTVGPEGPSGPAGGPGPRGDRGVDGHEGHQGEVGPEGSELIQIFREGSSLPAAPTGGSYNTDTGVWLSVPTGWTRTLFNPTAGLKLYFSYTVVHHTHTGTITPVWEGVAEAGSQGPAGATGPAGPRGTKGDRGNDGPRGDQGPAGGSGGEVDYSFIEALPLHFVAENSQFIQARPDTDDLAAATLTSIRAAVNSGHQASTNVYYNDSNELSFGPILSAHDIFPRAATIPDHTADDAPELFFLTDAITVGPRDDANVVVGFWNYAPRPGPAGFGSALVGFTTYTTPHIGSINRPNGSLAEIEGSTDDAEQLSGGTIRLRSGGTFSAQLINSHNEEWIDQWTHALINSTSYTLGATIHGVGTWHRNILNFPDDLTGDFTFNLRSSADEYFFTGSGTVTTHPVGLYTMSTAGYSLVAGFAAVHPQGRGTPQGIPDFPGQPFTNNLGELWIGAGEVLNVTVQPACTQSLLARTPRSIGLYRRDNIGTDAQFAVAVGNGGFSYPYFAFNEGTLVFRQNRGGTVAYRSWTHVWNYLAAIHPSDVQAARAEDHSVNLGIFTSYQDGCDDFDRRYTQQVFDGGATDFYYQIYTTDTTLTADPLGGVFKIDSFTAAHVEIDNSSLHWVGPYWIEPKFLDWLNNNQSYVQEEFVSAGLSLVPAPDIPDAGDTSTDVGTVPTVMGDGTFTLAAAGGGITFGNTVTWTWQPNTGTVRTPHGLGRIPDGVLADLINITSERGWPVGTVLPMLHFPWRVTIALDDTDVILQPSSTNARFGIGTLGTPRSGSDFTANRWQYRIRPYIFG